MSGRASPLELSETVKAAVMQLWAERILILKMLVVAGLANGLLAWASSMTAEESFDWFYVLAPQILIYTLLAVRVHRLVLASGGVKQNWFRWTWRETRFLGWLVVVYFYWTLILIPVVVGVGVASDFKLVSQGVWVDALAITLATVPSAYVFVRLAFLLPATAVDQKHNLRWAWELSKGNGWRLVILLWVLPLFIPLVLQNWEPSNFVGFLAWEMAYGVITVFEVALLSVAFRNLGGMSFRAPSEIEAQPL